MKKKLFSFNTPEFPEYNLEVLSFKGYQEVGELYSYEIDLISKNQDIDLDKMLNTEVSLQLHNNQKDTYIHGVLQHFEAHQMIDDFIHYKAYLVPKLWWLTLAEHQQIFLDKKLPDIIEEVLKDARFTSNDYEFRLQGEYDKREYVCQYKESRYDFIKRWMHRDGLYFYFESDENGCKVVIADIKDTQKKLPNLDKISYKPATGLQGYEDQAVSSLVYRSNSTIQSVHMRNYNYEKPSLEISSTSNDISDKYKETYLFGNNLKTQNEAKKLSKINAQKYKCLDKEMYGESNIVSLVVGNIYTLNDYFKKDLNDDYLMVRVECEGSQRGFLTTGFTKGSNESSFYTNTFMMIPAQTQYRMQTTPIWPHIGGMISATIDGQGSGDTAELDKHGRYKVIMPFDISGRKNAKASAYLRMAQPSAGEKQGMHFPLHKGTEVLIAFKGGDPDQPIITGAVPNINSPSPVNDGNVTKSVIQTHGGNIIHMEDTPGQAHIRMAVHDNLSSITIHNMPENNKDKNLWDKATEGKYLCGLNFETEGCMNTHVYGNTIETRLGTIESFNAAGISEMTVGAKSDIVLGGFSDIKIGGIFESAWPWVKSLTPEHSEIKSINKIVSGESLTFTADQLTTIGNNITVKDNQLSTVASKVTLSEDNLNTVARKITLSGDNLSTVARNVTLDNEHLTSITNNIINNDNRIEVLANKITNADTLATKVLSNMNTAQLVATDINTRLDNGDLVIENGTLSVKN